MGYGARPEVSRTEIPELVKYRDGKGYNTTNEHKLDIIRGEVGDAFMTMKAHPNYKDPTPINGESPIAFTLRAIAHLISPPQEPEESYDLECVDIAASVLAMKDELELIWLKHTYSS